MPKVMKAVRSLPTKSELNLGEGSASNHETTSPKRTVSSVSKKIDELLPTLATKLCSIPSKFIYPFCGSTSKSSSGRRMFTSFSRNKEHSIYSTNTEISTKECNTVCDSSSDDSNLSFKESERYDPRDYKPIFALSKKRSVDTILDRNTAGQIRLHLPITVRMADIWTVIYGSRYDGLSLTTLHSLCSDGKPQLLVISARKYKTFVPSSTSLMELDYGNPAECNKETIFGAFLNESFKIYDNFYGTSTCFLWRKESEQEKVKHTQNGASYTTDDESSDYSSEDDGLSSKNNASLMSNESIDIQNSHSDVKVFRASGENNKYIISDGSFIAMGVGQVGKFGLWINRQLDYGYTSPSTTYNNPSLIDGSVEGTHFNICGIEIWGFS